MDAAVATDVVPVAVIDSHEVVHAGIQAWCRELSEPTVDVVGGYTSAQQFLAEHARSGLPVGVVVLELTTEGCETGLASLRRLCAAGHRPVVYSHIADHDVIRAALEAGAISYVVKSEGRHHLLDAVRAAHSRTPYIPPQMAAALADASYTVLRPVLAPREQEVLIAWFQTDSKYLVAQKLFIAPTTVRTHLQRIRAKYAAVGRPAGTKAALVARAVQDGIVGIDDL